MRPLTDAQFWGGIAAMFAAIAAIVAGLVISWRRTAKEVLREDRARLVSWARKYAQQLAEQMFREYVKNLRINVPVALINESDIDWGEDRNKAA